MDSLNEVTLLYGGREIARVKGGVSYFPTMFGKYEELATARADEALKHVFEYVDYSVKVWPLIEAARFDDPAFEEEKDYQDLIDSDQWFLRDESGLLTRILIPVFCTEGGINWRLAI